MLVELTPNKLAMTEGIKCSSTTHWGDRRNGRPAAPHRSSEKSKKEPGRKAIGVTRVAPSLSRAVSDWRCRYVEHNIY